MQWDFMEFKGWNWANCAGGITEGWVIIMKLAVVWLTVAYSGADRLTVAYNDDLSESITPIMYVVGSPLGAPQAPPRLHRYILRWQNHVKAKIACVVDKILRVAAVIARAAAKSGIWGGKNLLIWK